MVIEGFWWFVFAIVICGAHVLYLRSWRRDRLQHLAWWKKYDATSQLRHEALMAVMDGESRMTAVFAAAGAWRASPRVDSLAGETDLHEARLIAAVDAARAARKEGSS